MNKLSGAAGNVGGRNELLGAEEGTGATLRPASLRGGSNPALPSIPFTRGPRSARRPNFDVLEEP